MRSAAESAGSVAAVAHPQLEFIIDGVARRVDYCDAGAVKLESGSVVRGSDSWQHKENYAGYYWAATVRRHVWFESLYERAALMRLYRDRRIVGLAAQPVWIHWPTTPATKHAPDYFVRFSDGNALLVDVRPAERVAAGKAAFDRTRDLCDRLGWGYRVVSDIGDVEHRNLRFLSGYRFTRWRSSPASDRIAARSGEVASLSEWMSRLRGSAPDPLGAMFSALWWNELVVDMSAPMTMATPAKAA